MFLSSVGAVILIFAGIDNVTSQTDWSGGPGLPGPVLNWGVRFDVSTSANWRSIPGQLSLSSSPLTSAVIHPLGAGQTVAGGIHAADIDGDGDSDVISTQYLSLQWWERLVDGTWVSHPVVDNFWGMAAAYVTHADLDQDGDTDIIVTTGYGPPDDGANGRVSWFENLNGIGTMWETHVVEDQFYGANRVAIGDIDGDGDLDLVSSAYLAYSIPNTDDVIWLENEDGIGHTWAHHTIDNNYMNALSVDLADVDGDGDLDVFGTTAGLPQANPNNVVWWESKIFASGQWSRHVIQASYSYAVAATTADMDGDGDPDVVAASYDFNQIAWYENVNPLLSTSWPKHLIATFPHIIDIRLADIDGDGDRDVLGYSLFIGDDVIAWWQNPAGTLLSWTQRTIATGQDYPTADAADVNQDGKLEIVATEEGTSAGMGKLWWWDVTQFNPAGTLTGSILDGGAAGHQWDLFTFDATTPSSTTLSIDVRAADDPAALGNWTTIAGSGTSLADVIDPAARYLQYRVNLSSTDGAVSPILASLTVALAPVPCPADINDSGAVNIDDLLAVVNSWGATGRSAADVNDDNLVNIDDLLAVINAWGPCS